jgi:hypothetical protein
VSLGLPVGAYEQVSTNFHAYDVTFNPLPIIGRLNDDPVENGMAKSLAPPRWQHLRQPMILCFLARLRGRARDGTAASFRLA